MIKTFKYMALAAFCAAAAPASAFTAQEQQTLSLARDFMQCMDDYNTQHDARRIPVQERIDRQEAENRRKPMKCAPNSAPTALPQIKPAAWQITCSAVPKPQSCSN